MGKRKIERTKGRGQHLKGGDMRIRVGIHLCWGGADGYSAWEVARIVYDFWNKRPDVAAC